MESGSSRLTNDQLNPSNFSSPGTFRIFSPTDPFEPLVDTVDSTELQTRDGFRPFASNPLILEGRASGDFTETPATSSTGPTFVLDGTIELFGLGALDFSGEIRTTGVAEAPASGQLSLSTEIGTITIALTGYSQAEPNSMPHEMAFHVTDSTGVYAHTSGSGIAHLALTSAGNGSGTIEVTLG
jgi:hypothetical protein